MWCVEREVERREQKCHQVSRSPEGLLLAWLPTSPGTLQNSVPPEQSQSGHFSGLPREVHLPLSLLTWGLCPGSLRANQLTKQWTSRTVCPLHNPGPFLMCMRLLATFQKDRGRGGGAGAKGQDGRTGVLFIFTLPRASWAVPLFKEQKCCFICLLQMPHLTGSIPPAMYKATHPPTHPKDGTELGSNFPHPM